MTVATLAQHVQPAAVDHALREAQALFVSSLAEMTFHQVEAGPAAYLAARPAPPPQVVGYASPGYVAHLRDVRGVDPDALRLVGLTTDGADEPFAGRITFPWLSMGGTRIIAFGGRTYAVGDRRPKYINSPESAWFSKGRAVFGIAHAAQAIHGAKWGLIVEGIFDAFNLWNYGWTNAVATVGAKVTLDQLLMVARLTDDVVVLLDPDEGGRRGIDALSRLYGQPTVPSTLTISVANLQGAADPAEATRADIEAAIRTSLPVA